MAKVIYNPIYFRIVELKSERWQSCNIAEQLKHEGFSRSNGKPITSKWVTDKITQLKAYGHFDTIYKSLHPEITIREMYCD